MWLENLGRDLVYAARTLRKSPGFTLVVIVTLALGIGANTAIFSFFYGVLLRPLPLTEPDRAVIMQQAAGQTGHIKADGVGLFTADYLDLKKSARSFADASTYTLDVQTLTGIDSPDMINCVVTTHNFFTVLGARAALGRTYTPDDARDGGRFAVLNHGYWRSTFGGNPNIVGQQVTLNDINFTVLGVMPADYDFPLLAKFYLSSDGPTPDRGFNANGRGGPIRTIIARLAPGVSIAQAQSEVAPIVRALPNPNQTKRPVFLVSMRDQIVGKIRGSLGVLFGCVTLVLLLACLNIANLVVARANARQRETAIRLALGAGRWRLVRQVLTESLLLSLLGGAVGVLVGVVGLRMLVALAPTDLPRLAGIGVDGWVLAFAFLISVVTGILCGLAPALDLTSADLSRTINEGSRGGSTGVERRRLRAMLVGGEVAISLVLLVGAGLLLRSFWQMQGVSWGFRHAPRLVSMRVGLVPPGQPATLAANYRALLDKLQREPGIESVATNFDRIGISWWNGAFAAQGESYPNRDDMPKCSFHTVNPAYFDTLGIPLVQGRAFSADDNEKGRPVAIVDGNLARRHYPDGAVGKKITTGSNFGGGDVEIVGVVGPVRSNGPEAAPSVDIYFPAEQTLIANMFITVRTTLAPPVAVATVRRLLREIDAKLPLSDIATMDEIITRAGINRRFPLIVICCFAALAIVLAAIGIYAVTAYAVTQRTREIGIRMALGSEAHAVVRLLVRQGFVPILIGLGVGLAGGTALAFAMRSLLFGIPPLDLATFLLVPLALALIAAIACWLPARRAAKIDPIVTLRAE
jgi:putative ABC transport system permease protein